MNKIKCSVTKCSHNNDSVCFANRVNIAGKGANEACDTCCGSFLDKTHYSTLTNNANISSDGSCDCLVCDVPTCSYYNNNLCTADVIQVGGENVNIYTETICKTFKKE